MKIVRATVEIPMNSPHYQEAHTILKNLVLQEACSFDIHDIPQRSRYVLEKEIPEQDSQTAVENFEFMLNQIPSVRVTGLEVHNVRDVRSKDPLPPPIKMNGVGDTLEINVSQAINLKRISQQLLIESMRNNNTPPPIEKGESKLYQKIKNHLDTRFIETEKIARILSLAIEGQKNCLLWGDAGHGKSQMVEEAINGLGYSDDCFIQSFGEGMDEARLFGGLDFAKFKKKDVIEYNAERSFLNYKIAVFEEIFDAPATALLPLKDTLTARELRNGAQRYPMKTECIIGLTNRSPAEISELGAAAHALIERFPLQLEVRWDTYNTEIFKRLFAKVKPDAPEFMRETLADMCADIHDKGSFISPRSAIHALETLIISANGNDSDDKNYFKALAFVPGFERSIEGLTEELERREVERQSTAAVVAIAEKAGQFGNLVSTAHDSLECLTLYKQLQALNVKLANIKVSDGMVEKRNDLQTYINELLTFAHAKAVDLTPQETDALHLTP